MLYNTITQLDSPSYAQISTNVTRLFVLSPTFLWQLVQYLVRLIGFHDVFLNESVNRPPYFFLWQLVQFLVRLMAFMMSL